MFAYPAKGVTEQMGTYVPKGREADELMKGNNWFVVDADGQVLGRLATRVARILIGKDKPKFTPQLDCGDHVVVINAEKIRLTGNKIDQKVYYRHSGYPGGLKETPVRELLRRRPEEVVREAVLGMLPKNKLRAHRAKKLRVYRGSEALARHAGQKPQPVAL
jgi:large subunit ribosomal protein L13